VVYPTLDELGDPTRIALRQQPPPHPTPNPTRARPHLAATHPPPLVRHVESKIRGTVTRGFEGWVAYLRLEDPPWLSPITTVGRFATVDEAQVATDELWVAR
jgi:hypothetical protein